MKYMEKISLLRCREYEADLLKKTITEGLNASGFNPASFKGKRVILKPNLLLASSIDRAIVTHPEFFRAAARIVIENGGKAVLAECPGFSSLEKVIKSTGYIDVVRELGIEVAQMEETGAIQYPQAKKFPRVEISKAFFDADIILNLPKFKTHGFTYITGAVKNLFGTMPGLDKSRMHMRFPQNEDFSEFLLDLYGALLSGFNRPKTILHVMDAVIGQEGEGPGPTGTPRKIGAIITGRDPVAVDFIAVRVAGLDYRKVLTITGGFLREFGISSPDEIQVIGEKPEAMQLKNFAPSHSSITSHILRGPLVSRTVKNLFVAKPVPDPEKCTLCYNCMKICPAGAISKAADARKIPEYDYNKCIRCFCCMEICPEAAIFLKRGKLQKLIGR
jgi:uncharacterized protein (DUF362 family)/ferredoxin